jgi:hypothetical protein
VNDMSRRQRSFAVVVAVALSLSLLPATRSTAATAPARVVGVGSQQPGIAFESPAHLKRDLDAIAAAGMKWVRADFFWSAIQGGGKGTFEWGPTDAFVKAANARHLHVLALVAYTPAWARTGATDTYPPKDPRDYATFVHAAARRYGSKGVHAWEIWNEPNLSMFWSPKADPVAYTALLKRAYPAIKSADPKAIVVTGGLSPASDTSADRSPMTFLAELYLHGAKGSFSAAGYHPYSFPYSPMYKAEWNTFYRTPDFHGIMKYFGDGAKAVWGTELGYPTGTSSRAVSEQRQADDLVAAINQWTTWSFTGPLILFTLRDSSRNKADVNDNMGMLFVDGRHKPSYSAIRQALN